MLSVYKLEGLRKVVNGEVFSTKLENVPLDDPLLKMPWQSVTQLTTCFATGRLVLFPTIAFYPVLLSFFRLYLIVILMANFMVRELMY